MSLQRKVCAPSAVRAFGAVSPISAHNASALIHFQKRGQSVFNGEDSMPIVAGHKDNRGHCLLFFLSLPCRSCRFCHTIAWTMKDMCLRKALTNDLHLQSLQSSFPRSSVMHVMLVDFSSLTVSSCLIWTIECLSPRGHEPSMMINAIGNGLHLKTLQALGAAQGLACIAHLAH